MSAAPHSRVRARPGRLAGPNGIRSGLTFRQRFSPNLTAVDGPCDPGNPAAAQMTGRRCPRSHGPAEERVNPVKANASLSLGRDISTERSPHLRCAAVLTGFGIHGGENPIGECGRPDRVGARVSRPRSLQARLQLDRGRDRVRGWRAATGPERGPFPPSRPGARERLWGIDVVIEPCRSSLPLPRWDRFWSIQLRRVRE